MSAATGGSGISETPGGEWVVPAVSYVDPARRSCAFCGRPIARRYWRVTREGEERIFCDPAHARLDATYPGRLNSADDGRSGQV